jgi:4-amino-4-deoxy-L-arabinose transferase-like glycosyltransferase
MSTNLPTSRTLGRHLPAAAFTRPAWLVRAWYVEATLLVGLGILGLLSRVPKYQEIPAFTDETGEILQGLLIAQGQHLPLTNVNPYMGSLWNYLLAAAFWVSDFSLYAPRTLVLALGVLTVVATYPLGRAWGGRPGGLLAATLMSTSAGHIVINSHVAWSNSMTPLWTTLAIWTLYVAVRGNGPPRALLLSGLLWGLAVQSHPSVLALLAGSAVFLFWRGRALLRTRWPYVAAGLFILINLNLLIHNLTTGFDSVSQGLVKAAEYARYNELTPQLYLGRLGLLLLGLLQILGGAVDLRRAETDHLLDLGLWPISLLAMAGVFWQWRRGNPLPALLLASTALLMPLLNGKYNVIPNGRYLAPLLPFLYAGVGALFADGLTRLRCAEYERGSLPPILGQGCLGLLAGFVVLHALIYVPTYYKQVPEIGWTNAPMLQTFELIKTSPQYEGPVILDRSLNIHRVGWGDGTPLDSFELALKINDMPYFVIDLRGDKLLDPDYRCEGQFVVLATREPKANEEIISRLGLQPFHQQPAEVQSGATPIRGLYVLNRLPDASPSCD